MLCVVSAAPIYLVIQITMTGAQNMHKLVGESVPDYADVYPLDDFIVACRHLNFMDYDGSGYYVKDGKMFEAFSCADLIAGRADRNYTHVAWFNK